MSSIDGSLYLVTGLPLTKTTSVAMGPAVISSTCGGKGSALCVAYGLYREPLTHSQQHRQLRTMAPPHLAWQAGLVASQQPQGCVLLLVLG
jgi:hypothetical protein